MAHAFLGTQQTGCMGLSQGSVGKKPRSNHSGQAQDRRPRDGHAGFLEALTEMLGLMQGLYASTKDAAEKRAITAIMEPLEERVEQVAADLQLHAQNIGAIRVAQGLTGVA